MGFNGNSCLSWVSPSFLSNELGCPGTVHSNSSRTLRVQKKEGKEGEHPFVSLKVRLKVPTQRHFFVANTPPMGIRAEALFLPLG
jgi:hypothetical protein